MTGSDFQMIKKEIDNIFSELDDINRQNDIVVHKKLMDWQTLYITTNSEKIALLKLLLRLTKYVK